MLKCSVVEPIENQNLIAYHNATWKQLKIRLQNMDKLK